MSIGKKFLSTVSFILIMCIFLLTSLSLASLFGIKKNTENNNLESQKVVIDNVEKNSLDQAKNSLKEYTKLFTQNSNDRFKYIENNIDTLSLIAKTAYDNGMDNVKIKDYTLINGVNFNSVNNELKVIYDLYKFLKHENSIYFYGSNAYYCSDTGIVINSPITAKDHIIYTDIRQREWYKSAKKSSSAVWSEPYEDLAALGVITSCSKAVYDSNNVFRGVVSIDFEGKTLINSNISISTNENLEKMAFNKYFIVNNENKIILTSDNLQISDYIDEENLNTILNSYNTSGNINILTFGSAIVSMADLDINNWRVCFIMDSSAITSNASAIKNSMTELYNESNKNLDTAINTLIILSIAITIIVMLIAYVLSIKLTKSITEPLDELAKGIKIMGKGNLKYKIKLKTNNELGTLSNVVNNMSSQLEENIKRISEESAKRQKIMSEIEIGRTVQLSMLPEDIDSESVDIYSVMIPARFMGGDFYDYFYTNSGKIAFVIGDVSGKGIGAALFMSRAKALINMIAKEEESPRIVMEKVNKQLIESNSDCMFVTAILGIIDTGSSSLTYSIAGHMPPILKHNQDVFTLPKQKSVPLGVSSDAEYEDMTYQLESMDTLILYTDGIVESVDNNGEFFGEDSVIACIKDFPKSNAKTVAEGILKASIEFSGGCEQFDDMTIMVINIKDDGKD